MNMKNWFKKDKESSETEKRIDARMESIRKKKESAEEIIALMKEFSVERRSVHLNFEGHERRNA